VHPNPSLLCAPRSGLHYLRPAVRPWWADEQQPACELLTAGVFLQHYPNTPTHLPYVACAVQPLPEVALDDVLQHTRHTAKCTTHHHTSVRMKHTGYLAPARCSRCSMPAPALIVAA